jgi:hypothetical protein
MKEWTMKKVSLIVMLFLICLLGFAGQASAADKAGLVGIQYGSEDFTSAENLVILDSLDKSFSENDDYGKQWSGRWEGFIKCPITGKVKFTAETDQNVIVTIGDAEIINTGKGKTSDTLLLTKKMKFPVKISFVKEGDEYDCYLRIKWSWSGQEPVALGGSSLVYADDVETKFNEIVAASDDGDDDNDDDDDDEEQVIMPPSWDENTIPGSDKLPIQYLGPELPSKQAGDGKLMYSPGVQNIQINRANRKHPPDFPAGTENEKGWTYQHHVGIGCWKGKIQYNIEAKIGGKDSFIELIFNEDYEE